MRLDSKAVETISKILEKGNSVEIRRRKDSIVIVEIQGKVKYTVTADGQ